MPKTVTVTTLMPKYVERFTCIGGECDDNCCARLWAINLDKEIYLLYQSSFDPELRPLFSKYVKRNLGSKDPSSYGYLKHTDDAFGSCGFLSEAKRCLIQERMGEKALSKICTQYPRKIHHFGDLHQMTLDLSCPVAARLALLAEDAFDFVAEERTFRTSGISTVAPKSGVSLPVMDDVRTMMFQILRTGDLDLPTRLKLVGLACERLTELIQKRQIEAIPVFLQGLDEEMGNGTAARQLGGHTERPEIQALVVSTFFPSKRSRNMEPHARQILDEVASGLGIREGAIGGPALVNAYGLGLGRLTPALANAPKLLEHYLLNEAMRELFPWSELTPMQHFSTLIVRFAISRMLLIGRAASRDRPLTPVEMAETIQVFSRLYLHSDTFPKEIKKAFSGTNWGRLDRLFTLL